MLAHKRLVSGCRQGAPPISIRALSLDSSPFSLVLGVEWHSDWLSANRFALLDMAHRYHRSIGSNKHGTVLLRQPLSALESLKPSMLNYSLLRHLWMHSRENKPDTASSLAGWLGSTLLDCCVEAKTEKLIRDVPPPCPTWRDSFQLLPRLHDDIRHELDGWPRVPSQVVEVDSRKAALFSVA